MDDLGFKSWQEQKTYLFSKKSRPAPVPTQPPTPVYYYSNSTSMRFCKTTTLIAAVSSHDMNQGSITTIVLSIKLITPPYRFTLLQLSKSQTSPPPPFKYTSNCCAISHTLTCLLHNLNRHYLPIRSQTNPVHISHSNYIILTLKLSSDAGIAN